VHGLRIFPAGVTGFMLGLEHEWFRPRDPIGSSARTENAANWDYNPIRANFANDSGIRSVEEAGDFG